MFKMHLFYLIMNNVNVNILNMCVNLQSFKYFFGLVCCGDAVSLARNAIVYNGQHFPLSPPTPAIQLAETVWNPKSLSFSWVNERLPWNAPVTKTLQQWKQPREQPEFTRKPYTHKTMFGNWNFSVGQLC